MPRPRGSRAAALPAAVSSYAGDSREVIGPPSALLPNAAAFAQTVEDALKEAEKTLEQIKQEWAGMTPEEYASVDSFRDQHRALLDNQLTRPDLRNWVEARWFPDARLPHDEIAEHEQDDDDEAPGHGVKSRKRKQAPDETPEIDVEMVGEAEVQQALQQAEASSLHLLKPPNVVPYFRKQRTADRNTLLAIRATEVDAPLPSFPPVSSTSAKVLYSLTFHPAGHTSEHNHRPQQQLVCLGTTTLAEIRDNLMVGGDNIPVEEKGTGPGPADADADASAASEDDSAVDEDGFGYQESDRQRGEEFFGGGTRGPVPARQLRWKNERRTTGAAFVAEDVVYADTREGMEDYASLILSGISKGWPAQTTPGSDEAGDPDLQPLPSLAGPSSCAPANVGSGASSRETPALRPERGRPALQRGPPAQEARLGDLPLRVGQPYLFVHQGDVEHIWSVDSVRALLPSDPWPWPPAHAHKRSNAYLQFRNPYPITTYLSRQSALSLSNARCGLCDRGPADVALLGDELTAENVAHVCRACFGTLHPVKRDWEEEARPKKRGRGRPKKVATPPPVGYEDVADGEREHMEGVRTVPILYER